jgi:tetratricopeptide (TPR) repeat protein
LPSAKKQMGLLLAWLYADWHEETKQCDLLDRLSVQFPDDISLLHARLGCPDVLKNRMQAQKIIDNIKAIEGEKGWQWRYEQARLWFTQSDFKTNYPQMVLLLKENLLADPDNQISRMLLAAAYEKAGDMRLAIATYEEALSRSPGDVRIIFATAGALYRVKEYDRADQILHRAAESQPENREIKQLQLQSFIRKGEIDSASAILEDFFAADPNNLSVGISLAFLQMQQKHMDEAAKTLLTLSATDPNSLSVAAANVELTLRLGKTAEAVEKCDEIVRKFHDASALVLRARTLASLGQIDKAQIDFEQAALTEPNNVEVWLAKSNFYRSINRIDKAIEDIQNPLLLDPTSPRVQKLAVFIYMASADPARRREGADLLDSALQGNPSDNDLRLLKSRELISQGISPSLEDAKNILEAIISQQPLNTEAWRLLAEVAIMQGQSVKALDIVLRGLAYRPNDKGLLLLRAKILKERSPMLAIPVYRALREIEPNGFDTAAYLAEADIDAGEYGQAIALLKSQLGMQNSPEDQRRLKVILAAALYKSGKRIEAEEIFTELQKSLPDDTMPLLERIRLLKDEKSWAQIDTTVRTWHLSHPGDFNVPLIVANELAVSQYDEPKKIAENLFRGVLQQKPDYPAALYSFALLLQATGRPDEAAELYQRILSVDPNYLIALNNLAWIMCEYKNQYTKALDLAERGIEIEPNYVDLIDTRGMVYYRLGQFERAVADFSRCVNLYPAGKTALAGSYFNLARALEKLGKTSQASENAKKAMELNSTTGGLTDSDLVEVRQLLQKLSEGG